MRSLLERIQRARRKPFHHLSAQEARSAYELAAEVLEPPRAALARVETFDMPLAVINLLDDERHVEDEDAFRLTKIVTDSREPLVLAGEPNAAVGENAYLQTNGIDLYAAVPLILPDGECVGALALLDYEPHAFGEEDIARLKAAADDLVQRFAPAAQPMALSA